MKDAVIGRSSQISRPERSVPPPLKLLESSRVRFAGHAARRAALSARPDGAEYAWLRLEHWLPINLRRFLNAELGPMLRIEDDAIVALGPGSEDVMMRELARAIRRFSFNRAREPWVECPVTTARLEEWLGSGNRVVLCLGCGRLSAGSGALGDHQGARCLPVEMNVTMGSDGEPPKPAGTPVRRRLQKAIEGFRLARSAADMPHYDLDCYLRNGSVVFTWRPLDP